jgi:hypothetical protein
MLHRLVNITLRGVHAIRRKAAFLYRCDCREEDGKCCWVSEWFRNVCLLPFTTWGSNGGLLYPTLSCSRTRTCALMFFKIVYKNFESSHDWKYWCALQHSSWGSEEHAFDSLRAQRFCPSLKHPGAHSASYRLEENLPERKAGYSIKCERLRMWGTIHPLPHTPWHDASFCAAAVCFVLI